MKRIFVSLFLFFLLAGVAVGGSLDIPKSSTGGVSEGSALLSTGEDADLLLITDGSDGFVYGTVAGTGDVIKVGTPVDSQVGVWTGDGTIEGTAGLLYDGTTFTTTGNIAGVDATLSGDLAAASGAFSGTGGVTFTDNGEWINSPSDNDSMIFFQGVAGIVANQNIVFGLDGDTVSTGPSISSDSSYKVSLADFLNVIPPEYTLSNIDIPAGSLNIIGISLFQKLYPSATASGTARGVKIVNLIASANFDGAANKLYGGEFANQTLATAFGGEGSGGSATLDVVGLRITGAESVGGATGIFSGRDHTGATIRSIGGATAGHTVYGDVTTLKLFDSAADFGDGSITNTILYIEYADANTTAALNDQILLEGAGGSGIGAGCSMNVELDGAACTGGTVLDVGATYQLCVVCD